MSTNGILLSIAKDLEELARYIEDEDGLKDAVAPGWYPKLDQIAAELRLRKEKVLHASDLQDRDAKRLKDLEDDRRHICNALVEECANANSLYMADPDQADFKAGVNALAKRIESVLGA